MAKFGCSGSSAVPRCVVNGEFCGDACGVKLLMNEPTAFIRPFSSSAEASPAAPSRAVELSATATSSADAGRTRALPPRLLFAEPDGERRGEEEEAAAAVATAVDELRLRATNALREEEVGAPPPAALTADQSIAVEDCCMAEAEADGANAGPGSEDGAQASGVPTRGLRAAGGSASAGAPPASAMLLLAAPIDPRLDLAATAKPPGMRCAR